MNGQHQPMADLEKDVLQEIMNISFGQAAADLSEIINLYVTLTVPHIDLLDYNEILPFINQELHDIDKVSMVNQLFSGKFSGTSVLIFPHVDGHKMLQLFSDSTDFSDIFQDLNILEKEALIEMSNIIMGACIGKIAQLLKDVVSFSPPRYFSKDTINVTLENLMNEKNSFAIVFKTKFQFMEHDVSGFLFLVCNSDSLDWLKLGIADYMKQYTY